MAVGPRTAEASKPLEVAGLKVPESGIVDRAIARLKKAEQLLNEARAWSASLTAEIEQLREERARHDAARERGYGSADEAAVEAAEAELDRIERAIERKAGIQATVDGPIVKEHQRWVFLTERDAKEAVQQYWRDVGAACLARLDEIGGTALLQLAHRASMMDYGPDDVRLFLRDRIADHVKASSDQVDAPDVPGPIEVASTLVDPRLRQQIEQGGWRSVFHAESAAKIERELGVPRP